MTRCDITTFDSVEVSDLPYDDEARVQKLILNVSLTRLMPHPIPALTHPAALPLFSRPGWRTLCPRSTRPASL